MKLQNEQELENTRRKLTELEALIARNAGKPNRTPISDLSLQSMKQMATKLRAEILEYEQAHQMT
ncbi:MAG: hypothetical protein NTU53_01940 [Planctomycetota bacterium]|nr:hypothetical protein [Planctomycetota bacterium]